MTKALSRTALVVTVLFASTAWADEIVRQEISRGRQAQANFSRDLLYLCDDGVTVGSVHTGVMVLYNDFVVRGSSVTTMNDVTLYVYASDSCKNQFGFAMATLPNAEVRMAALEKARIRGAVQVMDMYTGLPLGTVRLDLALDGTGEATRTPSHYNLDLDWISIRTQSFGASRSATVSGSITLDGEELIGDYLYGQLSMNEGATVLISKP